MPSAPSAPVAPLTATFHREVVDAVLGIALEKPPHAAALAADRVFVHDARGWRSELLAASLRPGPTLELSLFYGRDNRVRLVGSRQRDGGLESVYLRWLPAGFHEEAGETGNLSAPRGGMVAVLGTADPEIVCRPGNTCLVKRLTGWKTVKAPDDLRRVAISAGVGWAVAGQALLRLEADGWSVVGAPGSWRSADTLFIARDQAWILETNEDRLHTFDGAGWQVSRSPLARPRAIWGEAGDALWLAGDEGLAYFDGSAWRAVLDAPAPLVAVAGRAADDVWVGGAGGLFRIERAP